MQYTLYFGVFLKNLYTLYQGTEGVYNLWPHEGESIAQAWGRLKSMLYSCPNHELSREIIYAQLSLNNRSMLDTSCTGSFMMRTIEFRWGLLEIIKATLNIGISTKVRSQV